MKSNLSIDKGNCRIDFALEGKRKAVEQWLKGIGLQLHPNKTKISHTLEGKAGFDFLGFSVRQYQTGKYGSNHGFKTLIKPSQQGQKYHLGQLKKIVSTHGCATRAGVSYLLRLTRLHISLPHLSPKLVYLKKHDHWRRYPYAESQRA